MRGNIMRNRQLTTEAANLMLIIYAVIFIVTVLLVL
jgi:hypothetical protein